MTTLTVSDRPASDLKVDALVLATVKADSGAALAPGHGLPKATGEHLTNALKALSAKGTPDEVIKLPAVPGVAAPLVVLTGLGAAPARAAWDHEVLRRAAGSATRALGGVAKVGLALPGADAAAVGAVSEGALYGAYAFAGHRSQPATTTPPGALTVLTGEARDKDVKAAVKRASALAQARAYARDLVNTAPNLLYPQTFADSVKERAAKTDVKVSVLDEKALLKGGFGGIMGVGQGSANPPRIVTMTYAPSKARAHIAFVGKGITFDSGGLCIKPPASMLTMKSDMAGAAAVAAAVLAAAELQLLVAVTGYLCLAENMPGGNAQRPGDVVTMRGGKTVEIIDTDAEGRMVMADGLVLAGEKKPDAILDIATLTGAQQIALGNRVAAVMANDDTLRDLVRAAGNSTGDALWPMPLPADMRPNLDSQIADIAHKGDKFGGMLTAGIFLGEFIPQQDKSEARIPWAHLDIAGPSFNESGPWGYTHKGATGFGVATLVAVLERYATAG
ncbi:leucyl aminopeptidase [Oryzihumus sp.]